MYTVHVHIHVHVYNMHAIPYTVHAEIEHLFMEWEQLDSGYSKAVNNS